MNPNPESPRSPINIVLCSDGTGNSANKNRGTNVFKIYEAVDVDGHKTDPNLREQVAFYDDGVGTNPIPLLKALTGALGIGVNRNVRELYTHLVRVYQPGDKVFVFGFSRGAYTVRVLAGFIASMGIVDCSRVSSEGELQGLVRKAYRINRSKYRTFLTRLFLGFRKKAAGEFREKWCHREERHVIEFIGVWDTVDAVGLPWDGLATALDTLIYPFRFPDTVLSAKVKKACHAVAIDDERKTFHPVMWSLKDDPEPNETENGEPRIEQVWFAGVHSNVGGGYPKQGMSMVSLNWMIKKAKAGGLRLVESDEHRFVEHGNVHDKLYNSRSGFGLYYRYEPRNIVGICRENGIEPAIHPGALERAAYQTEGYAPGNIPFSAMNRHLEKPVTGRGDSYLDRVGVWVSVRKYAHGLLTILSFVSVYFTFPDRFSSFENAQAFVGLFSSPEAIGILKELLWGPWGALFLFFFLLSFLARKRMEKIYAEGWHPIAPQILSKLRRDWPWSNRNP